MSEHITEAELALWLAERTLTDSAQKVARYDRLLDELQNARGVIATLSKPSDERPFGRRADDDLDDDEIEERDGPSIDIPEIFQ